jgi:hypothetical protein
MTMSSGGTPPTRRPPSGGDPFVGLDARRGLLALRLGIGTVWALNLIFIFDPVNGYFSGFGATAVSFAGQSLGGTGFPLFVASYPTLFSTLIAGVSLYLAVSMLLGATTRWGCVVGIGFAIALLISQFGSTFVIPGGTDVGPMPIYVTVYAALYLGHAERNFSLDAWWSHRRTSERGAIHNEDSGHTIGRSVLKREARSQTNDLPRSSKVGTRQATPGPTGPPGQSRVNDPAA